MIGMKCHEASILLSEQHEHQLTFRQRVGLRLHLLICNYCQRALDQINLLRASQQVQRRTIIEGRGFESATFPKQARDEIVAKLTNL